MDITVKEYEHRHLAMSVCEHKCNVGEKICTPSSLGFWPKLVYGHGWPGGYP